MKVWKQCVILKLKCWSVVFGYIHPGVDGDVMPSWSYTTYHMVDYHSHRENIRLKEGEKGECGEIFALFKEKFKLVTLLVAMRCFLIIVMPVTLNVFIESIESDLNKPDFHDPFP